MYYLFIFMPLLAFALISPTLTPASINHCSLYFETTPDHRYFICGATALATTNNSITFSTAKHCLKYPFESRKKNPQLTLYLWCSDGNTTIKQNITSVIPEYDTKEDKILYFSLPYFGPPVPEIHIPTQTEISKILLEAQGCEAAGPSHYSTASTFSQLTINDLPHYACEAYDHQGHSSAVATLDLANTIFKQDPHELIISFKEKPGKILGSSIELFAPEQKGWFYTTPGDSGAGLICQWQNKFYLLGTHQGTSVPDEFNDGWFLKYLN
jgi:hypothetical protein